VRLSAVVFLTVEQVEHLHRRGLEEFGGSPGVRDRGLLESAVMAAQATFGGAPLNPTLATMAAVLAHGITKNHPFVDGNKRAAVLAALAMLAMNGYRVRIPQTELTALFLRFASDPKFCRDELVERFVFAMGGDVDVAADE
jgi:death on curing protein